MLPWPRAEVCVSVWLSQQRAATHLEVSVHNIMLVDMIDTLQDLTNAMTTKKGRQREGDVSVTALHHKHHTCTPPGLQRQARFKADACRWEGKTSFFNTINYMTRYFVTFLGVVLSFCWIVRRPDMSGKVDGEGHAANTPVSRGSNRCSDVWYMC